MKASERQRYGRAVVEIRNMEKRMLDYDVMRDLLKYSDVSRVRVALERGGYSAATGSGLDKGNYDLLLRSALEHFANEILALIPGSDIMDTLFLEYDKYNVMALLMSRDSQIGFAGDLLRIPAHRAARYRQLALDESIRPQTVFDKLFTQAKELYREKGAKALQEALDRQYHELLLQLGKQSGVELLLDYATAKVDFYNITSILRLRRIAEEQPVPPYTAQALARADRILVAGGSIPLEDIKSFYTEQTTRQLLILDGTRYRRYLLQGVHTYGYSRDLSLLEKRMDDYLTELFRERQFTAIGPEALLGYFHGRRIEILNIRLVATSIFLGIPRHIVTERLRESYA